MEKETKWSVDLVHSEISFKVRHLMISNVKGSFKTFDTNIYTTGKNFLTAEIDVWIDAASITTGDKKRDEHLKSADFFDVSNHKQIGFVANTINKPDKKHNHELWGELTMKGITKTIKLDVEFGGITLDSWGNEKAGFSVSGILNRKEWGLDWNTTLGAGGLMVSEEVHILCELQLKCEGAREAALKLVIE
jgi:polyisoprenoid-binding protein YceI